MEQIMKNYLLPLALVSVVALQACNQKATVSESEEAKAPATPATPAAPAAQAGDALTTPEARLSYGIAYSFGQNMATNGVPLNVDAFQMGLSDAVTGAEPRLSQEEMAAEMQGYQEKAQAEQQAAQAAMGEANIAASAAFLAENGAREGVVTTDSGLQYEVVTEGSGPTPGAEDTVEVHYRGTLVDGTEFDSSYSRGEPVTFGVGQVIPGWTEALQLMPTGSKWKLAIPSDLAYGAGGAGAVIGPNAALVFEVELIAIPSQEEGGDAEAAAEPAAEAG
jgi:FKBP-type peptidyl-prolyl cis-trans isomerase